jgi:hypothetical protein
MTRAAAVARAAAIACAGTCACVFVCVFAAGAARADVAVPARAAQPPARWEASCSAQLAAARDEAARRDPRFARAQLTATDETIELSLDETSLGLSTPMLIAATVRARKNLWSDPLHTEWSWTSVPTHYSSDLSRYRQTRTREASIAVHALATPAVRAIVRDVLTPALDICLRGS